MPYTYPEEAKMDAAKRTAARAQCYLCRHFQKEVWLATTVGVIATARCLESGSCFPDAAHLCVRFEAKEKR